MSSDNTINYEYLVQESLRNVVKKVLSRIEKDGLIGKHHYYITFLTSYAGVKIPQYLIDEFGEELTIVIQYEFWDLKVENKGFFITLCFDDNNEELYIPFKSIVNFVDPFVKFALEFVPDYDDKDDYIEHEISKTYKVDPPMDSKKHTSDDKSKSNVISLNFKKKD